MQFSQSNEGISVPKATIGRSESSMLQFKSGLIAFGDHLVCFVDQGVYKRP